MSLWSNAIFRISFTGRQLKLIIIQPEFMMADINQRIIGNSDYTTGWVTVNTPHENLYLLEVHIIKTGISFF